MEFEGRARIATELNIAPLIDVVFLLLIFFMLTSTLITQEGIEVSLPGATESKPLEKTPIVVSLNKIGQMHLNGTSISETDLRAQLAELLREKSDRPISLQTHADLSIQHLVSAMDLIRSVGGHNIALATKRGK